MLKVKTHVTCVRMQECAHRYRVQRTALRFNKCGSSVVWMKLALGGAEAQSKRPVSPCRKVHSRPPPAVRSPRSTADGAGLEAAVVPPTVSDKWNLTADASNLAPGAGGPCDCTSLWLVACDGLMPHALMHDFIAAANFSAGPRNFLQYDLPMSWWSHLRTAFLSPHAFDIACAGGAFAILCL